MSADIPIRDLFGKILTEKTSRGFLEAIIEFTNHAEINTVGALAAYTATAVQDYFSNVEKDPSLSRQRVEELNGILRTNYDTHLGADSETVSEANQATAGVKQYQIERHKDGYLVVNGSRIHASTRPRALSLDEIQSIFDSANEGKHPADIADQMGRSKPTIDRYLAMPEGGGNAPGTVSKSPGRYSGRPKAGGAGPLHPMIAVNPSGENLYRRT